MNLRDALLLGLVCVGAIGGAIYCATRIHRSTYAVLALEARFLHTQLRAAGSQLGMDLVPMPVFHDPRTPPGQRWPALPFLRGQRGRFQIVVAPDYYWALTRIENEDFDLQHLDLVVRIAPVGSSAIAVPTETALAPSQLQQFWEAQKVRQGVELTQVRKNVPACEGMLDGLCDPKRRPMRAASVRQFSDLVQAVIEYPDAPRVTFDGSTLRAPLDATALDKLLSELAQVAEMCTHDE